MIQRIQTVFLLLASALILVSAYVPLSSIVSSTDVVTFYATHSLDARTVSSTSSMQIMLGVVLNLVALLGFVTILLFKKRKLQLLLCALSLALVFLSSNLIVALSLRLMRTPDASISFHFASILPIVAFILFILAYRAIKKDEKLVRSLDRIR